jgi:hypothetical protein
MTAVAVAVQTVAGREAALDRTRRSIEASDIGTAYCVLTHAPGQTVLAHCVAVLAELARSPAAYALRLEDDVIVNRHVLHNLTSWAALDEPNFGGAWLYVPRPLMLDRIRIGYGPMTRSAYRINGDLLGGSLGVFFRTKDLPAIIDTIRNGAEVAQDWALSRAIYTLGRVVYFCKPSLLEHDVTSQSSLGHSAHHHGIYHTSQGYFHPSWKRGRDPERPRFGP